jgi:hypothetical protein
VASGGFLIKGAHPDAPAPTAPFVPAARRPETAAGPFIFLEKSAPKKPCRMKAVLSVNTTDEVKEHGRKQTL